MGRISISSHDDDPFTRILAASYAGETLEQRRERVERETAAKLRSEQIDEQLNQEREKAKKEHAIEILLLGQSESGKSTTLKQFQILADQDAFKRQRGAWKSVVYINLIRSVRRILSAVSKWVDHEDDEFEQPEDDLAAQISNFRQIKMRISPLLDIERTLIRTMGLPEESFISPVNSPYMQAQPPLPEHEYYVRPNTSWVNNLMGRNKKGHAQEFGAIERDNTEDPTPLINACGTYITELWTNPLVRTVLTQRKLWLEEEGGFFLDDIERVTSLNYAPTDSDIIRCRLKTVGVSRHDFTMNGRDPLARTTHLRIYDVGGARSQRATWAPFFDSVTLLLFLAPISAFDQYLEEDSRVNRIKDSLDLWKELTTNPILKNVPIVLFLNKCDLLRAKLNSGVRVNKHITSYEGPNEFEPVAEYLRKRFDKIGRQGIQGNRDIRIHLTTVTDTRSTSSILAHISDLLMREQLRDVNLLS